MGNCYSCSKEQVQVVDHSLKLTSLHSQPSKQNNNIFDKYTKVTMDSVFLDSLDEISYFSNINLSETLNFKIQLQNIQLLNNSKSKSIAQIKVYLSEDMLVKKKDRISKVRQSIYHHEQLYLGEEITLQNETSDNESDSSSNGVGNGNISSRIEKAMKYPGTGNIIDRKSRQGKIGINSMIGREQKEDEGPFKYEIWKSKKVDLEPDSQANVDSDFEYNYDSSFDQIWDKSVIFKLTFNQTPPSHQSQNSSSNYQITAYIAIEFLVLAVGPKHYDMEYKDFKTGQSLGRIQFDLLVEQMKQVEVSLNDLSLKLTGKEDKALYAQFKCIHSSDIPEMSQPTQTQAGKYKKDLTLTHFKWKMSDSIFDTPSVKDTISLESLKNATLQILVKIDLNHTENQREKVIKRLQSQISNEQIDEGFTESQVDDMLLGDDEGRLNQNNIHDTQPENYLDPQKLKKTNKNDKSKMNMLLMARSRFKSTTVSSNTLAQIKVNESLELINQKAEGVQKLQTQNFSKENNVLDNIAKGGGGIRTLRSKSISHNRIARQSLIIDAREYYKNYRDEKKDEVALDNDEIGECYIGFSKLLQTEYRQYEKKDSFILQNKISFHQKKNQHLSSSFVLKATLNNQEQNSKSDFNIGFSSNSYKRTRTERRTYEEKLWRMGKVIGQIKGSFCISNLPMMNQMSLGILTEQGIVMNQIPILLRDEESNIMKLIGKNQKKNEKVCTLIELTQKLQKLDQQKPKNFLTKYKINSDKEKLLKDIQTLLSSDKKQSTAQIFKYFDELDMIRGQQSLIDLAFHCIIGEFRLNHLAIALDMDDSFNASTNKSLDGTLGSARNHHRESQVDTIRKEKIRVAQFFKKLICYTLDDALNKFCRKDVEPYMKQYLESCISLNFFRVPEFQNLFLECLKDGNEFEIQIKEWKGINWDLDDKDEQYNFDTGLVKLFDWKENLFNKIPKSQEVDDAQRSISRIQGNQKWQSRIEKRTVAFFQIVKNWAEFIQRTVQTYSLYWQDIPGYRIILKSIIIELKERNIPDYPDPLIEATLALIQNTQLLNVFVQIVFLKTNAYDSDTLQSTLLLVQKWINYIEKQRLPFPSNFDFGFFFKGLLISLEIDHSLTVPRTLYLLYKTLHFYPIDQRCQIVHDILSKYFYQLIFSWSYTIREVFICFLFYQVEYALFYRTTNFLGSLSEFTPKQNNGSHTYQNRKNKTFETLIQNFTGSSSSSHITMKDQIKINRKMQLQKVKEAIHSFEVILYSNPNDPTNIFNRQSDLRSINLTSGLKISLIKQNKSDYSPIEQNFIQSQANSSRRKGSGQDQQNKDTIQIIQEERVTNKQNKNHKMINQHIAGDDKKEYNDQKVFGKVQTLRMFVSTFNLFKQKIKEIEILDRIYSLQTTNEKSQPQLRLTSDNLRINERNIQNSSTYNLNIQSHNNSSGSVDQKIKDQYEIIIQKVPQELRVYAPQAVAEFYRYAQEYETWRQKIPFQPQGYDFTNNIPDFNMEKSMPVEDDENLEKPEEW